MKVKSYVKLMEWMRKNTPLTTEKIEEVLNKMMELEEEERHKESISNRNPYSLERI